jgi:hypothetical protein
MARKTKAKDPAPEPVDDPAPAARPKRAWSTYNQFVHDHYGDAHVQSAKVRDRLKIIGKMWQDHKKTATPSK